MEVIVYQSREKTGKKDLIQIQKFLHESGVSSSIDSARQEAARGVYRNSKWLNSFRDLSGLATMVERYPCSLAVSEENAEKARELIRTWESSQKNRIQPALRKVHIVFLLSLVVSVVATGVCAKWFFDDLRLLISAFLGLSVLSFILISLLWDRFSRP